MKFLSKPREVEIERVADLLNWATNDWDKLPEWIKDWYAKGNILFLDKSIEIYHRSTFHSAKNTEYIIRDSAGDGGYPCSAETLALNYAVM